MTWNDLLHPSPTPLQQLTHPAWRAAGVELWIKRDDLLAPAHNDPFCGNKWRKLQHNLLAARAAGHQRLLTFGGAYSNHIAAVASAGHHLGFETVGIIRGEAVSNPTLERARSAGMQLHFVDRVTYRRKNEAVQQVRWQTQFAPAYLIPEGGTNPNALLGCSALAREITDQLTPTHLAVACGTGGTLAGLVQGLSPNVQAIGISVLKGNFMAKAVAQWLDHLSAEWTVYNEYHHGGYAKSSPALRTYIQAFYDQFGCLLDPIYTGKLFFALEDLLRRSVFAAGDRVVAIHTGGLQSFASRLPSFRDHKP
ncbi:MAG: pyridoxal-phosphate dependent enzyme [Bacteroidota bacterium]